jgi:3-hydroxybutyryl-CoA dehydratase
MQDLPTSTLRVTAEAIAAYAELTQDFNPLHLDPAFAATTPMKGVIAHGTLSINLIWRSVAAAFGASALDGAELQIRFLRPVGIGETLVAGGRRSSESAAQYDVWVRGSDEGDRLAGTVTIHSLHEGERPSPTGPGA